MGHNMVPAECIKCDYRHICPFEGLSSFERQSLCSWFVGPPDANAPLYPLDSPDFDVMNNSKMIKMLNDLYGFRRRN